MCPCSQVKGVPADLDVTVHLVCDNFKAMDMKYRRVCAGLIGGQ